MWLIPGQPPRMLCMGGAELLATLIVIFIIDLIGRKILIILSGTGMVICTMLLGVHFYITRPSLCSTILANLTVDVLEDSTTNAPCNVEYAPLAIVSITTFNLAFSTGWGTIPWIRSCVYDCLPTRDEGKDTGRH